MRLTDKIARRLRLEDKGLGKQELTWLLGCARRYKKSIFVIACLGIFSTLMGLASSVASKYLIDAVTGQSAEALWQAALAMVLMLVGSLALQAFSSRVSARIHVRVRNEMQHRAYRRILSCTWESLDPFRSGDLLSRLSSDIQTAADGVIGFGPELLAAFVRFFGAFGIILCYDPGMALVALLGAPATLLMSKTMMKSLRRHSANMKKITGEVMSFQEDSFRNLTSIKSFSAADWYSERMDALQSRYAGAYMDYNRFQVTMSTALSAVGALVSFACLGWGVYRLWTGDISYGSMTMFLQLATSLRGAFQALVSLAPQAISIGTSASRIMAVELLPEEDIAIPEGFDREQTLQIHIRQADFRYHNGDVLLHSFDFSAMSGQTVAITGPSGEGKTTLLRLLLGLVAPCSGEAVLEGSGGKRYPINAGTRSVFAYVPQGSSVFAGTVAENLRIIRPDATDAQLKQALEAACAWEFVEQLPLQLEQPLGPGGRSLSEGQAQRLAIARALLKNAPFLLLDEATSALDSATEARLLQNLQTSGLVRTCIFVTHRSAGTAFCSRVYEIRHGRVEEVAL